jgi:hypothetical protein
MTRAFNPLFDHLIILGGEMFVQVTFLIWDIIHLFVDIKMAEEPM